MDKAFMNFVSSMNVNSNVKAQLLTLRGKDFLSAIWHSEKEVFTALKGVGEKTAQRIVDEARYRMGAGASRKLAIGHYSAPMYRVENMLDPVQIELLHGISNAVDAESLKRAVEALKESIQNEHGAVQFYGLPEFTSLPRSELADILNVKMDEATDKVSILSYRLNVMDVVPMEVYKEASFNERAVVNSAIAAIQQHLLERLVFNGYVSPFGVKYTFFTSSPGQLKKESGYWLRSDEFDAHQEQFWGGLCPRVINLNTGFEPTVELDGNGVPIMETGKDGNPKPKIVWVGGKGIPMTKVLQWRSLLTTASVPSSEVIGKPIRLRNLICVGEMEKTMTADVMSISDDYKVARGVRDDIANNMADGYVLLFAERVGWIVVQIRSYGQKGAAGAASVFSFIKEKYGDDKEAFLITDIDGVVHDIRKEKEIFGITNTSVFKMAKAYGGWKPYVEAMEALGMDEIRFCAIADGEEQEKRLSRQMTQSLFALSDDEIEYLASDTLAELDRYSDPKSAAEIVGETHREFSRRSNLGKLVSVYPDMLAEPCVQRELHDRYVKQYNSLMCGEQNVHGVYQFVLPDPCAIMDMLFGKKAPDDPTIGWLKAGECFCDVWKDAQEIILLRSPHAFMEWATAKMAQPCAFVAPGCVYTSVHDLTFRVLQMDYDGDHLLCVNDAKLVEIVKRMKTEFDIPVLYYEPSKATDPAAMPMNAKAFAAKVVECLLNCKRFNKVGVYSNYVTAAWSTYRQSMSEEERNALLREVAVIAAAINHAVDAQKTYALEFLEDKQAELVRKYKQKPCHERYRSATPQMPSDDPAWDAKLRVKGEGTIDRIFDVMSKHVSRDFSLDVSAFSFDWKMLRHPDAKFRCQIRQAAVSGDFVASVHCLFDTNNESDLNLLASMEAGQKIGFSDLLPLMKRLNTAFFARYVKEEDDVVKRITTNAQRIEIMRRLLVDFARAGTQYIADMEDDDVLACVAQAALSMVYGARKYREGKADMRRFIFDTFGDLYAEAVMLNIAEGYTPSSDDELDYSLDVELYDVPMPIDGDGAVFEPLLDNELGDLA